MIFLLKYIIIFFKISYIFIGDNMDKKEEFKIFAKTHPELVSSVKNGTTSWQKLYEIYDIYGTDNRAWDPYLKKTNGTTLGLDQIVKNIDMDSVQKHINTAQKALGLVQELTTKQTAAGTIKGPLNPRPINKFFED